MKRDPLTAFWLGMAAGTAMIACVPGVPATVRASLTFSKAVPMIGRTVKQADGSRLHVAGAGKYLLVAQYQNKNGTTLAPRLRIGTDPAQTIEWRVPSPGLVYILTADVDFAEGVEIEEAETDGGAHDWLSVEVRTKQSAGTP